MSTQQPASARVADGARAQDVVSPPQIAHNTLVGRRCHPNDEFSLRRARPEYGHCRPIVCKSNVVNVSKDPLNPILAVEGFNLNVAEAATQKGESLSASAADANNTSSLKPTRETASRQYSAEGDTVSNAFTVTNVLSQGECKYIMQTAGPFLDSLEGLYNRNVRDADRVMIKSDLVARQLYKRILPFITKADYVGRSPMCFGHNGVWVPFGLNECLKIFRYSENSVGFQQHRDGPWVPQHDRCSMYTVVIYLNDEFEGGNTLLYDSIDRPRVDYPQLCYDHATSIGGLSSRGSYANKCSRIFAKDTSGVFPKTGKALLFNHDMWHAGMPVRSGQKWILRTELIFFRVHSFYVDQNAFGSDPAYLKMRALYDQSQEAAVNGDREGFFTMYQEVVRLQREAMLREDSSSRTRLLAKVGLDELSIVMSFLTDSTIGTLLRLNRQTASAVMQAPYWHDRLAGRLDGSAPAFLGAMARGNEATAVITSGTPFLSAEVDEHGLRPHNDYFTLVKERSKMLRHMVPAGLFLLPSGVTMCRFVKRPEANRFSSTVQLTSVADVEAAKKLSSPRLTSKTERRSQRYADAPKLVVVPTENDRCTFDTEIPLPMLAEDANLECHRCGRRATRFSVSYHTNMVTSQTQLQDESGDVILSSEEWYGVKYWGGALAIAIQQYVPASATPLVIVPPLNFFIASATTEDLLRDQLSFLVTSLFEEVRPPAIALCHPAVCAVLGLRELWREGTLPDDGGLSKKLMQVFGGLSSTLFLRFDICSEVYDFSVDLATFKVVGIDVVDKARADLAYIVLSDSEAFEHLVALPLFPDTQQPAARKAARATVCMRQVFVAGFGVVVSSPTFAQQLMYRV